MDDYRTVFELQTHYHPAMPFGNRKRNKIKKNKGLQYYYNAKNITPLKTWNLFIKAFYKA